MFDKVMTLFACFIFSYVVIREYQDDGWIGVIIIVAGGLAIFAIIDIAFEWLARRRRSKSD
jgi:hypothetical protein